MSRIASLALFLILAAGFAAAPARAAAPRPNIIVIMADDMGFSDIGPYGGEIRTPSLDRLAREGMRFIQFYNNAKCTTTRASLLSGMYPRQNGNSIPLHLPTAGEAMRAAGYQTALCGKWHLGSRAPQRPIDRGFDEFYGLMDGCCNYFNPAQPDPPSKGGKIRVFGHNDELITSFPEGFYTTDAFTDHAIKTIRRFRETGKPFFLHLAYTSPHYPLHAPPEDIARYRGKYMMGWEELRRQRHARQLALGLLDPKWKLSPTDSKAYDWEGSSKEWEDLRMATYAAMVDRMDQNIGRLLDTVRELGIERDTVILFLADNGGCTEEPEGRDPAHQPGIKATYTAVGPSWGWAQNTPFRRYKSWVNEGGVSTPLIVRWPGRVEAGSRTSQVGHIIDVVPTCLELAGAQPVAEINGQKTEPLEGRSLLPVIEGRRREPHEALYWEWSGNCAIRKGDMKLVWDTLNKEKKWELYDLAADRTELNDLAGSQPELVRGLAAQYEDWAKRLGRAYPGKPAAEKKKKKK